jgi:hypothetical protein
MEPANATVAASSSRQHGNGNGPVPERPVTVQTSSCRRPESFPSVVWGDPGFEGSKRYLAPGDLSGGSGYRGLATGGEAQL